MRTLFSIVIVSSTLAALLVSCSGSKAYAKKAGKLDDAGLYTEAADMYLQAVQRNAKNVDAKIGLKKTGQQVLDDKLSDFFRTFSMGGQKRDAVNIFLDGRAYFERVQRLGVQLEIPDHYKQDFEQVKGEFLVELYQRGTELMEKQDFKAAEATFAEIARLEPTYKDATSLQSVAYLEPLYRQGSIDLEAGHYRKAYDALNKVVLKDAGYKDARELRDLALSKGQYSIAVLPFTTSVQGKDLSTRFSAYAITSITESGDPFLKVVDRDNIDRILQEQRLGLSGVVDEQTAVKVGNLMGAQAVLMGSVLDYREEAGHLRRSTKDGFESYKVRQLNSETGKYYYVTKYRPVKYTEYFQENKVYVSVSYKLVSLETGEVLMSRVVEDNVSDNIYYANYDGDKSNLFPTRNGVVDTSKGARNDLSGLLNGSRSMKPMLTLSNDVLRKTSTSMSGNIRFDLATKLP